MKAYVTSIGENTAELCVWSLVRLGIEVEVIHSPNTSLSMKLEQIYNKADDDFFRVDADVICNANILQLPTYCTPPLWWVQALTFDWFKQDLTHGGVNFYRKEALPYLRQAIDGKKLYERPETEMSRMEDFYRPRRFETADLVCGLHGYKQLDIERVKATKERRKQKGYDWALAERIDQL